MMEQVTAFAPGSIGNLGPGLDILGLAIKGPGDTVLARRSNADGIEIADAGHPDIPTDAKRNTAGIAAHQVLKRMGTTTGITLTVKKGLPLSGGQGGSAASAIAAAVAVNALLELNLGINDILECALVAESTVAGRHLDNLAPSLLGGLVLVRSVDPIDVIVLPVPEMSLVLVHPDQRMLTKAARGVLPTSIPLDIALQQAANVSGIVAAACLGDLAMLGRSIDDQIAEPARAPTLRGFTEAKLAALDAGAIGCSISGAGPTAFAIVPTTDTAADVAAAMIAAYAGAGVEASAGVHAVDQEGARWE
jgi:homoserine kinase